MVALLQPLKLICATPYGAQLGPVANASVDALLLSGEFLTGTPLIRIKHPNVCLGSLLRGTDQ